MIIFNHKLKNSIYLIRLESPISLDFVACRDNKSIVKDSMLANILLCDMTNI